jgi:hypothetical protein
VPSSLLQSPAVLFSRKKAAAVVVGSYSNNEPATTDTALQVVLDCGELGRSFSPAGRITAVCTESAC